MPHETEVDRIMQERMRQREAAQREQKRIATEAAARQLEANHQRFLNELGKKVSAILDLLPQIDCAGAEEIEAVVKVRVLGVFFRRKPRIRAGWFICTWHSSYFYVGNRDDSGGTTIRTDHHLYLFSDGSIGSTTSRQPCPRLESYYPSNVERLAERLWVTLQSSDSNPSIVLTGLDELYTKLTDVLQHRSQKP